MAEIESDRLPKPFDENQIQIILNNLNLKEIRVHLDRLQRLAKEVHDSKPREMSMWEGISLTAFIVTVGSVFIAWSYNAYHSK